MFANSIRLIIAVSLAYGIAASAEAPGRIDRQGENALAGFPQETATLASLIQEAEREGYEVRRTEFLGNARTADMILRRRLMFTEGDKFTGEKLEQSIRHLSRLKVIKPVRLKDVEVRLDRQYKVIDMAFHIREKRRAR